ncbi:hypothetical protein [Amycolatopsis sp. GA6-003]|uniref:hypothetical protein n=1 Tax=Amycolatopsis sp. GA6-003 TaxID=2652444 RepID=UPI003916EE11
MPEPVVERLLTLSQRTASWCTTPPWQVIVPSGAATERFRSTMTEWAHDHPAKFDFAPPAEYRGGYRDRRLAAVPGGRRRTRRPGSVRAAGVRELPLLRRPARHDPRRPEDPARHLVRHPDENHPANSHRTARAGLDEAVTCVDQ